MPSCVVKGCPNRCNSEKGLLFYNIPSVCSGHGKVLQQKTMARRKLWLVNINRKDLMNNCKNARVCSKHFHGGKPARDGDETHPDYAPTLNLPQLTPSNLARYERRKAREVQAAAVQNKDAPMFIESMNNEASQVSTSNICVQEFGNIIIKQEPQMDEVEQELNPLQLDEIDILRGELALAKAELTALQTGASLNSCCFQARVFFVDDAKVEFYTGFLNAEKLWMVFRNLEDKMESPPSGELPLFEQFCLTLMYLRLNLQPRDLAYRFNLTEMKVLVYLDNILCAITKFFVPKCIQLPKSIPRSSLPEIFSNVHLLKCISIADILSVRLNNNMSFKFLALMSLLGEVVFVSDGFPATTVDFKIWKEAGVLNQLFSPGDKVLQIQLGNLLMYNVNSSKVTTSSSTNKIGDLHLLAEKLPDFGSFQSGTLRHYIQTLIDSLKSRFAIFREVFRTKPRANNVPLSLPLESFPTSTLAVVNQMVKVCCALHNSSLPVSV